MVARVREVINVDLWFIYTPEGKTLKKNKFCLRNDGVLTVSRPFTWFNFKFCVRSDSIGNHKLIFGDFFFFLIKSNIDNFI